MYLHRKPFRKTHFNKALILALLGRKVKYFSRPLFIGRTNRPTAVYQVYAANAAAFR